MPNKSIEEIIVPSKKTLIHLLSRNLPKDTTRDQLEAIIDQEIFNFQLYTVFKPEILECHEMTIESAFRKTIMQNLSFDQDFGLVYIMTRNTKIGTNEFKSLECKPTVNGWISIYKQAGSLEDLLAPDIQTNPKTGLIDKVTIRLIVPQYSNSGEITGRIEKPFDFTHADFKIWQTASHNQNSSQKNPGNFSQLSLSNANYWNYKPNQKNSQDAPTPANPGGMNPGFAITKCTGHALKRANLSKNPYAKKVMTYPDHKRYVQEEFEEHFEEHFESKPVPDFYEKETPPPPNIVQGEAAKKLSEQEILKTLEKPTELREPYKTYSELKNKIIKLAEDCNTREEVMSVYVQYKKEILADESIKSKISKIGIDRRDNPRVGKTEEPKVEDQKIEQVAETSSVITSDDL